MAKSVGHLHPKVLILRTSRARLAATRSLGDLSEASCEPGGERVQLVRRGRVDSFGVHRLEPIAGRCKGKVHRDRRRGSSAIPESLEGDVSIRH